MDDRVEAGMDSFAMQTALEESSREAAEQALIESALRLSLRDHAEESRRRENELARAAKDATIREQQEKTRALRGPDARHNSSHLDEDEAYPHDPLPGPNYIRILTVLSSEIFHETINCNVESVPLDSSSWYSAVSYSWGLNDTGDAARRRTIVIDGTPFRVTQNLFDFLLRVRDRSRPRRIWVDAICINQIDPLEQSSQVANMAKIYQNADKVLVWLGEGTAEWEDKLAYNALKWFSLHSGRIAQNSDSGWNDEEGDRTYASLGLNQSGSSRQASWQPIIEALNKIWSRRYFTRRWIVQELASAPPGSIRIMWGSYRCSYGDFLDGADQACSIALEMINGTENTASLQDTAMAALAEETIRLTQKVKDVAHFHDSAAHGQRQDICYVLSHCNALQCMDDRDILFALAKLDLAFGLEPDYTAAKDQVYVRFACKLLEMSLLEQVLANAVCNRWDDLPYLELPSWVPDLRLPFIDVGLSPSSLATSVSEDNILESELYCFGTVSNHIQATEGIVTLLSLESALPQQVKIAPHQRHVKPGDIACCTAWKQGCHVVFLRSSRQYYKIVHVMGQNLFTPIPFVNDPPMSKSVFQII